MVRYCIVLYQYLGVQFRTSTCMYVYEYMFGQTLMTYTSMFGNLAISYVY